jgi:hypothetical protein
MPKTNAAKRTERVVILYSEEEYQRLKKYFSRSISKTVCRYVRKVSLEEPVEILVRNASFDAFIEEVIQLRKEMVLVRKLTLTPERENMLIRLLDDIKSKMNKITELCMQQ